MIKSEFYLVDFVAVGFAAGDVFAAGLGAGEGFLFASVAAAGDAVGDAPGEAAGVGDAAGVGVGDATGIFSEDKTELDPVTPGNDKVKAISMNAIAAPIVILAKMFCVPRGPNAVLETLLVNKAPASALPGCSRITTTSTKQASMNNVNKM